MEERPTSRKIEMSADGPFDRGGKQHCDQNRVFWSSFMCFSSARNLASTPPLLLKEYCAGFGLENLTPSAGVSDRPIEAATGAWRRLEFFRSGVSNEIEAEFNTRT
jgi:hypothetical protein